MSQAGVTVQRFPLPLSGHGTQILFDVRGHPQVDCMREHACDVQCILRSIQFIRVGSITMLG